MIKTIVIILTMFLLVPPNVFAGSGPPPALTQSDIEWLDNTEPDEEVFAYYDLRNRKTYIQVTNVETQDPEALPTVCLHIQIFQQDQNCDELDFEDELTPNDTVIYDMDNLVRNDGSPVPVNLNDDSYGYVAISAYECGDRDEDGLDNPLLGNFRIIDDSGYEYRMNLITDRNDGDLTEEVPNEEDLDTAFRANIVIPFNTVDGATHADLVAFVMNDNTNLSGSNEGPTSDLVYNEETGVTFDVFQIDENEERLSCDRKTIGCGPTIDMNYGINEDYPNSKGGPLLCEGAGLLPGQRHGYISLENATMLSPLDAVSPPLDSIFEFVCLVGLNNGNGTGSMDPCQYKCTTNDPITTQNDCGYNTPDP